MNVITNMILREHTITIVGRDGSYQVSHASQTVPISFSKSLIGLYLFLSLQECFISLKWTSNKVWLVYGRPTSNLVTPGYLYAKFYWNLIGMEYFVNLYLLTDRSTPHSLTG